ncbi:DUF1853 family protein [soil metagenome]
MDNFQSLFHQEWQHLQDPHVRALAWILTSPSMLAKESILWNKQIATLVLPEAEKLHAWLSELDQSPAHLHEALAIYKHRRLGHYAENLLAFFLNQQGILYAHGMQVHADRAATIGEFDFLLHHPGGLLHWEIATKFYLLERGSDLSHSANLYDYLGPNLADTLGAKMEKIFQQQLMLSQHPIAKKMLPSPVIAAQALIKGWLFYRQTTDDLTAIEGLAQNHCRGYWWSLEEIIQKGISYALVLPRLQWLAPAQTTADKVLDTAALCQILQQHFLHDNSPVLLAVMRNNDGVMQEDYRGMVVPDDWLARARALPHRRTFNA